MNSLIPVLNYTTFYEGYQPPPVPIDLFNGYDLEEVILTLVGIRNSLEKNDYIYEKDGAINAIINCLPTESAERLKQFIYRKPGFSLVQPAVIDKILVDLFSRLSTNEVPLTIPNGGQFELCILDVLLSYNESHYDNGIVDRMNNSHELVWNLTMMQGMTGVSKVDFVRTGPIKHLVMLDFLRKSLGDKFPALQKSLQEKAGLANIYQFLGTFLHIFSYIENNNGKETLLPQIQKEDPLNSYIEPIGLMMNREIAAKENFDIGIMLSKPFFETSSGDIVVLDHRNFSLLLERVFIFLLYYKSDFPKLTKIKNLNGLYSHFGKCYYENFLMYNLLSSMKRNDLKVISSDDHLLADFTVVLKETDVFVIEVKSVALHYNIFNNQDVEKFRSYIEDHYLCGGGTIQLERYISYIREDRQELLSIKNPSKKINIYPIIVFTDPQIKTYGVNNFVGQQADKDFAKFKSDFNRVMPLTMIHSDFFVENIELLSKDKYLLKKLIREYHFFLKKSRQRYSKHSCIQNYLKSMVSFDNFAIGKYNAYRVPQGKIFLKLGDIFGLKEDSGGKD